jgi:hypothetical protein
MTLNETVRILNALTPDQMRDIADHIKTWGRSEFTDDKSGGGEGNKFNGGEE